MSYKDRRRLYQIFFVSSILFMGVTYWVAPPPAPPYWLLVAVISVVGSVYLANEATIAKFEEKQKVNTEDTPAPES
jgi:hypothetical protein